jgi:hypothetical protein
MMRKLLVLSFVAVAAGAAGCARNPCGEPWRPRHSWFGGGRQNYQPYQQTGGECCDPCGGGAAGGYMGQTGMMAPAGMMGGPAMTQAPCCQ